jgi:hypothetical protein
MTLLHYLTSAPVGAQENSGQGLTKLVEIGGSYGWQKVEQASSHADQIRKNLEHFKLPTGFTIRLLWSHPMLPTSL